MKKSLQAFSFAFLTSLSANSQKVVQLTATPSSIIWAKPESTYYSPSGKDSIVANVSTPSLTVYLPKAFKANGTAMIIAPGGGFHLLAIENEGQHLAEWCVKNGIAAFVLKYRLVPTERDAVAEFFEKMKNPKQAESDMEPVIALAKADGLVAIEYVRNNAMQYNINPNKIGITGFSAGGTVAAAAVFEYTSASNRPDFSAPIYPAIHVINTDKLPEKPIPLFVAVTADDMFGFQNLSIDLFKKLNVAKRPIELHIYENGGHGFGMKNQNLASDKWIDNFSHWMKLHGWL